MRLGGEEDGVAGAEVTPVSIEESDGGSVLRAQSLSAHHMRHLPWTHLATSSNTHISLHLAHSHLERGVEAGVGGLESSLDHLKRTSDDGSRGSTNTETKILSTLKNI